MRLFSTHGRRNRLSYFLHSVFAPVLLFILMIGLGAAVAATGMEGAGGGPPGRFLLVFFVILGAMIASGICVTIQRLHDIDRPGTHWWLLLVPIHNVYLSRILMFQKGTEGSNAFGPDPLCGWSPPSDEFSQSVNTNQDELAALGTQAFSHSDSSYPPLFQEESGGG